MANFDFKTATPDTTFPSGGFLFGADSQSASDPSIFSANAYRDYLVSLANTFTAGQTIALGTITADAQNLSATATWNNAAVAFTALKLNVTNTASANASLLGDLQVGGTSRFSFGLATGVSGQYGGLCIGTRGGNGGTLCYSGGAIYVLSSDGSGYMSLYPSVLGFEGSTFLRADASNVVAQRNGTNAQAFRIYNTYTDASNYERGLVGWSGNEFVVGVEYAGTGAQRQLTLKSHSANMDVYINGTLRYNFTSTAIQPQATNSYDLGITTRLWRNLFLGGYQEITEMTAPAAPAADKVRIYAQDNGAGKTQLMALFATGAAQQIAIEP